MKTKMTNKVKMIQKNKHNLGHIKTIVTTLTFKISKSFIRWNSHGKSISVSFNFASRSIMSFKLSQISKIKKKLIKL